VNRESDVGERQNAPAEDVDVQEEPKEDTDGDEKPEVTELKPRVRPRSPRKASTPRTASKA
jgi:hypothetical protein